MSVCFNLLVLLFLVTLCLLVAVQSYIEKIPLKQVLPWPISEFKESTWHVQKGHLNLVTQVDLILQNQWKLKALMTISLKRLSSLHTSSYGILLFLQLPISPQRFATLFISNKLTEMPALNCIIHGENFLKTM